jgi:hypothetical protein
MDAPNAFSSELEKWIYNRSIRSIFFVNIVAKDINQIEQRMNEALREWRNMPTASVYADGQTSVPSA